MAIKPYLHEDTGLETFLKANAIKQIIASDINTTAVMAFLVNSRPTEGPMELKLFSSSGIFPFSDIALIKNEYSSSVRLRDLIMYPFSSVAFFSVGDRKSTRLNSSHSSI